ncbi:MAG: hypothetical protein L3J20_05550 [Flavobacteriaceae bacterium]|nr:hypothetical protein [Flavobacteriaceae bacterium]
MKISALFFLVFLSIVHSCTDKDFSFKKKDFKEVKTLQIFYTDFERPTGDDDKINFNIVDQTIIDSIFQQFATHSTKDFISVFSGRDTKRVYETLIKQGDDLYQIRVGFVDVVTDPVTWQNKKEDRGFVDVYKITNRGGEHAIGTFYDDKILKIFDSQNPLFQKK